MKPQISGLLDRTHISLGQYLVVALALAAITLDGLDVQLLALVTPVILGEWQVDKASFTPVLAAALIGMALGSYLGGSLGDRFGRRPLLIGSTLSFGAATALVSLTHETILLTLLRFVGGLGFGAALPNAFALGTEWLPQRSRARALSLLTIANPLGGMIGATGALALLPLVGWRGCFALCGLLTIALGAVMLAWLPESPGYLIGKGRNGKASSELKRIARVDLDLSGAFEGAAASPAAKPGSIFVKEFQRHNIGAGLTLFFVAYVTYSIQNWIPTALTMAGLTTAQAITASLMFNFFAIGGALASGFLVQLVGSRRLLLLSSIGALAMVAIAALLILSGQAPHAVGVRLTLYLAIGLIGVTTGSIVTTTYAVLAYAYSAERRATGLGFGAAMARIGGIAAVLTSGMLLQIGGRDSIAFFLGLFVALLVVLGAGGIMDRHIASD
ncbi:MAG TPA: MFS transporter [Sphingobium sp.]|nr:MFS transporter [Sphingobium sp.]